MAKFKQETHAAKKDEHEIVRQTQSFDDNLLPASEEIAKLKEHDPDIMSWLKARTEKEQDFRHNITAEQVTIAKTANKRHHDTSRFGVIVFALLILSCMGFCYLLLCNGHNVEGSLFGGTSIALAIGAGLAQFRNPSKNSTS